MSAHEFLCSNDICYLGTSAYTICNVEKYLSQSSSLYYRKSHDASDIYTLTEEESQTQSDSRLPIMKQRCDHQMLF